VEFRLAERADVPAILDLLADDDIARARGDGEIPEEVDAGIWAAFEAIDTDPNNELIVGVDAGEIVATCQLTFTPGVSGNGTLAFDTRYTVALTTAIRDISNNPIAAATWSFNTGKK